MTHHHKWQNKIVCFNFLKAKTIRKIASRNSDINIPIKSVYCCISTLPTTFFSTKECHIAGSFVKLINLSENTSGICQVYVSLFSQ